MGAPYEFNWYLVVANKDSIIKIDNQMYSTLKSENRIYPIDSEIPLIIKNVGCVGIIRINKFSVYKNSTEISFEYVMKLNPNDNIANHYYNMYLEMKNK